MTKTLFPILRRKMAKALSHIYIYICIKFEYDTICILVYTD